MNRLFTLLTGLILLSCSKILSTSTLPTFQPTDTNKDLIGTWEFYEMRDNQNKKVHIVSNSIGYRHLLNYKNDGTYKKTFTTKNTDEGIWTFDPKASVIIHYLLIDSMTMIGKNLIKRQLATKYTDGNYYEIIKDKIIVKSKNEIEVYQRKKLRMKYRKINNGL